MNRQPSAPQSPQSPRAPEHAYVRPSLIEAEPVMFALALVALVLSISLLRPAPQPQQAAPAELSQTVAAAPQP